jgi:hypothetical protein
VTKTLYWLSSSKYNPLVFRKGLNPARAIGSSSRMKEQSFRDRDDVAALPPFLKLVHTHGSHRISPLEKFTQQIALIRMCGRMDTELQWKPAVQAIALREQFRVLRAPSAIRASCLRGPFDQWASRG